MLPTFTQTTPVPSTVTLENTRGMYGLLGPNGAGKSTLMRSIATLQTPSSGAITFDGVDVVAEPEAIRLDWVFAAGFWRLSTGDCLRYARAHGGAKGIAGSAERKETVETLLNQVNLWKVRKKAIAGFSGGMRQRFGIAQALIGNPDLIITDEPTAGLDPEERNRFLNLLAEVGENVVVILSTHIVEDVADLCPRMAVLVGGKVQLEGAPSDLIASTAGMIWEKTIPRAEYADYDAKYQIISSRLMAGQSVIHIMSDADPGEGFTSVSGGLEDVYFTTLARTRGESAAA